MNALVAAFESKFGNPTAARAGLNRRIKRAVGLQYRRTIRRSWTLTPAEIHEYQSNKLIELLEQAVATVPYYRERADTYRIKTQIPMRSSPS